MKTLDLILELLEYSLTVIKYFYKKVKKDDYYSLIGGRVKYNELTSDALIREVKEEIGIELNAEDFDLINVVENFLFIIAKAFMNCYSFTELRITNQFKNKNP